MNNLSSCRFCKSSKIKNLKAIQSPHFNHKYLLYHCLECNSKFHNPNEIEVSLDEMYNDLAKNENKQLMFPEKFTENRYWIHQKRIITKLLKKNPQSVLDVGCRNGQFLLHFNKKVDRIGVELAKDYTDYCNKMGLKVYADFIENIKFEKQFDIVSCYAVLEHVTEPLPIIDDLKKNVAIGGVLVVAVPWHQCLKEKLLYKLNIQWHMFCPPSHLNFFSKKFLTDYITEDGDFKLIKSFSTSGSLFNPFRKIPILGKAFGLFMHLYDMSFMNKIAIFDHLYVYYKRVK